MRLNKSLIILFLSFIIIFNIEFSIMASSDIQSEIPDSEVTDDLSNENQINNETSETHEEICPCGRDIYLEDGPNYSKYDCVKCRKNMYLCTCACWCGSPSYWATSTKTGLLTMYCRKCELPCADCLCANKTIALIKEQQLSEGKLSTLDIPKPKSIISILFLGFFIALFFILSLLFVKLNNKPKTSYEDKKDEENILKKLISKIPALQTNSKIQDIENKEKHNNISNESGTIIKWPIIGKSPAISVYELCNNILYKNINKINEETFSYHDYIKDFLKDPEAAKEKSISGNYGEIHRILSVGENALSETDMNVEALKDELDGAVNNNFWDIAENSISNILENDDNNYNNELVFVPFNNKIKIGSKRDEILNYLKEEDSVNYK
ncbi:MAG: hypothetical protein K0S55_111 [Clostridia bacterium]|nr:hypothetical protein [Clostridia bacterium]